MSRNVDSGRCTAMVLSGRLNGSDIPGSSSYRSEQHREVVDSHKDVQSRASQWRSASPSDDLDLYPVFDVQYQQQRQCQTPAVGGRNGLNGGPFSTHDAHLLDIDKHDGHRAYNATNPQSYYITPRPSGMSRQNYTEHQRQHDCSSPEMFVSSLLDLRQRNNYNCASLTAGQPQYCAYCYGKVQNGHAHGGSDLMPDGAERDTTVCNGLRGPDSVESSNSTMVTPQSRSYGTTGPSSSRLDVNAADVSPRLEAHELSLSRSSVPLGAVSKTPCRSASTSSSSSSSSTPNVIRRHLKTIAQTLDVRLPTLGSVRIPARLRSRTPRHEPVSSHRKLTLTRSNSEPEALDRVAGVHRRSEGYDEYGFSNSCPSYRIRALRDQQDDEPPSSTTFVGRSSADGGAGGCARSTVDDAVTSSKCSTVAGKSSKSTTKVGPRLRETSQVRCVF